MRATVHEDDINRIVHFDHHDPFGVLGAHEVTFQNKRCVAVRAFNPAAKAMWVVDRASPDSPYPMVKIHNTGFFEFIHVEKNSLFAYDLQAEYYSGQNHRFADPYSFAPVISDFDRHLFNEGTHQEVYEKLGAHLMEISGVRGVLFAVWAPNARSVSVIGDFNAWDNRRHPMRVLGSSGIWELFVPGLAQGDTYKFAVKTQHGRVQDKADPYGFFGEVRPKTGSRVWDITKYAWKDSGWMAERAKTQNLAKPMSVYEVHPGSWKRVPGEDNRFLTYRELAVELTDYVKDMGYTHVELMPVSEHPFDGSWGYQVTGYYAPTSRYGTPDDFMFFVDHMHQNGIGVLVDWVPGHFPKDDHGLSNFDGTGLYEHADPRKGEHLDWGTKIFNYGRNEVRNFLISNALFWLDKYHIDGFRVDAVASMLYLDYSRQGDNWVPNQYGGRENLEAIDFMKKLNELVYAKFPGATTIAEESTAWGGVSRPTYVGGLGFEFKWNMGWMHDTLVYMSQDPVYRKYHQGTLTFSMIYAFSENFILVFSHDEVVHGKASMINKMPGDMWQKFANLRLLYTFMWSHPGKKLLFMGQDFGQWDEWSEARSLDWHLLDYEPHRKLRQLVRDLNRLYKNEPALYEVDFEPFGFEWVDFYDSDNSVISFIRKARNGEFLVIACNFTPVPRYDYRIGVPHLGRYEELLNSDSDAYWGGNIGNGGGLDADAIGWQGRPYSLKITLPPLGAVIFKYRKSAKKADPALQNRKTGK